MAVWALFYIASRGVQLSVDGGAVVTREGIGMPVEGFVPILDSRQQLVADWIVFPFLCGG